MLDIPPSDDLRGVPRDDGARRNDAHDYASGLDNRAFAYAGAGKHYALYPEPRVVADARLGIRKAPAERKHVGVVVVVHLRVDHGILGKHGAAADGNRAVAEYLDALPEPRAVADRSVRSDVNAGSKYVQVLSTRLRTATNRNRVQRRLEFGLKSLAPVLRLPEKQLQNNLHH